MRQSTSYAWFLVYNHGYGGHGVLHIHYKKSMLSFFYIRMVRIALVGKYTCLSDSYLIVLKVVEELAKTRLRNSLVFKDTCGSSHREVSGVTSMAKHIRL
ncbi:hypothetical protein P8452_42103 [Trifolium repens]|nr:hypothetical protein P8452_42103 [Trifolium repens]